MPSVSQSQRAFFYATKSAAWIKAHHFDNKGHLPDKVRGAAHAATPRRKKHRRRKH
jgi:hypothetical protein